MGTKFKHWTSKIFNSDLKTPLIQLLWCHRFGMRDRQARPSHTSPRVLFVHWPQPGFESYPSLPHWPAGGAPSPDREQRLEQRGADESSRRACSRYLTEFGLSTAVLLDQVTQLVVDVLLSAANLLKGLPDVLLQFVQVVLQRRDSTVVNSRTKPAGGATHPHKSSSLIPTLASSSEVLIPSLCWCIWSTWILQSCTIHSS